MSFEKSEGVKMRSENRKKRFKDWHWRYYIIPVNGALLEAQVLSHSFQGILTRTETQSDLSLLRKVLVKMRQEICCERRFTQSSHKNFTFQN